MGDFNIKQTRRLSKLKFGVRYFRIEGNAQRWAKPINGRLRLRAQQN